MVPVFIQMFKITRITGAPAKMCHAYKEMYTNSSALPRKSNGSFLTPFNIGHPNQHFMPFHFAQVLYSSLSLLLLSYLTFLKTDSFTEYLWLASCDQAMSYI